MTGLVAGLEEAVGIAGAAHGVGNVVDRTAIALRLVGMCSVQCFVGSNQSSDLQNNPEAMCTTKCYGYVPSHTPETHMSFVVCASSS